MGYYDYEPESAEDATPGPTGGIKRTIQPMLNLGVRLMGLVLILVGLVVGISVVLEAWVLYRTPERIEHFAQAIERGSNIDGAFRSVARSSTSEVDAHEGREGQATQAQSGNFRLSYFAAWAVVLVLMLVIGTLAMSATATGAKLILAHPERR